MLSKCENDTIIHYDDDNPVTDETCITLITVDNTELTLFFTTVQPINNFVFILNHYYELISLGHTDDDNIDILDIIISNNLNIGSHSDKNKVKEFLEIFRYQLIQLNPELVLYKDKTFIKKYWKQLIVSSISVGLLGSCIFFRYCM